MRDDTAVLSSSRPTSGCRRKIPRRLGKIVLSRDASEIIRGTREDNQFLYSTHQIFFTIDR